MIDYLILAEKPSAAKNFSKALGGSTGSINGKSYKIVNSFGHLLTLKEPQDMVDASLVATYKSWNLSDLPWKVSELKWAKTPIKGRNPRTGKVESTASKISDLKNEAKNANAIVIATDTDPSGEGDLLAWEIIDAIGWHGTVYRANFEDEGSKAFIKAMNNLKDVSNKNKQGDYLKAEARNRWDYLSMQLTRIATSASRNAGYSVKVANQGRLKSVILFKVYDQLRAIEQYVKKPYYEVKFEDDNGHKFTRKFDDAVDDWRFDKKADAVLDMSNYTKSKVANIKKVNKAKAPDKLLDLSALSAILSKKGYSSKVILATYQKMYEAQIVSYPRTEDKTITPGQFNDLDPLVDKIAKLVDVNVSLLTHRTPRKTHVKSKGAHGANRPGLKVPISLSTLDSTYGKGARDIYVTLAKNYLAMYGEDYQYVSVTANIEDYPLFTTSFSIPVQGVTSYKNVFDSALENSDDDSDSDINDKDLSEFANPIVDEGSNKKPTAPTVTWIMKFLEKNDVGTGATRVGTLGELTGRKVPLMYDKKGRLSLSDSGKISAILAEGTQIASVSATKKLFELMDAVGELKIEPNDLLKTATSLIKHDMEIMKMNVEHLDGVVEKTTYEVKEKTEASFGDKIVKFNKVWGGHTFTPDEISKLSSGDEITFEFTSKSGKTMTATGRLEEQSFKGKKFWGFKPAAFNGKPVK